MTITKINLFKNISVKNEWNEITVRIQLGDKTAEISCGYTESLNWVITSFDVPDMEDRNLIASTILGKMQSLIQMKLNFISLILDTEAPSLYKNSTLLTRHGFTESSWSKQVLTWRQRGFKVRLVSASETASDPQLSLLARHYFNDQGIT